MVILADLDRFPKCPETDEQIELEISITNLILVRHPDRDVKLAAFETMRRLIWARSPGRVVEMERERGLLQ